MTAVYSGGALEGVLKVVVSLGGDRLELRTGQIPSAFVGTRPLRLTLPATSSSMLQALCAEMGAAHQARGGAGESRFSYALASGAEFEVKIRGSLSEPGTASILVLRSKAPRATIILTGIFPRNDNMAAMPIIDAVNARIARFADGRSIRYLDINHQLADAHGQLFDGMMGDKLHPTIRGYQIWADALKPIFTELLGPPAKEDHAPPPTGDPSVAGR